MCSNLTRAFWKSLMTSTVSSMSASSKVEAPARPHSCARNLAMAMDWETVAPCHSSTGSWPYGRDGFRVFMSSAHVEIDIRCILCYVDMYINLSTDTDNQQSKQHSLPTVILLSSYFLPACARISRQVSAFPLAL